MAAILEFEKPIVEIQKKINELKELSENSGLDMEKQIKTFEKQAQDYKKELYSTVEGYRYSCTSHNSTCTRR